MSDKPGGVKDGATLSQEWRQKGYHCQIWADYKYYAGVIEGEVVTEASDRGITAVTKRIRKDLDYREHRFRKEPLGVPYDDGEEIPQEYECPICSNRKIMASKSESAAERLLGHLEEEHPESVFPDPK